MKRVIVVILSLVALGCGAFLLIQTREPNTPTVKSLVSQEALAGLSKKDASGIDTTHLADGLTPPTNKWFSGIALQAEPKKVFPTPLSFLPTNDSFILDMPHVQTTEKSILAADSNPVTVQLSDAAYYRITRYDELSVDLTYYQADNVAIAVVTIASGSPYVYYSAVKSTSIRISSTNSTIEKTVFTARNDRSAVYAKTHAGASFTEKDAHTIVSTPEDSLVTFFAAPPSIDPTPLIESSDARLTGTSVSYEKVAEKYETTIRLKTSNSRPTVLGLLPHQSHTQKSIYTFDTIYGEQRFIKSEAITFSTPRTSARDSLDLSKATDQEKDVLLRQLRLDINATQFTAEDTYFGGKQLYRAAQLLQLAKQLDQQQVADTIQQKLRSELLTWLKVSDGRAKKVFYYDTKIKGIVGETASFGSQEFNDHHFHYGYFIYAASILAKYDHEFKDQYSPMVNLLVADIANLQQEDSFPLRRTFDPYFGHSWASGSSPFNDGNNQESVSEAINAWVGVQLWAKEIGNQSLLYQAEWMLSNEYQSALSYWLKYDMSKSPYIDQYTHTISPLNWGGKRDYATFFSAEPSALLGILLLPMNPTMLSFKELDARIPFLVNEARANPGPSAQFADYLLMLESLTESTNTLATAQTLPDSAIDNANSRSYMYAWIMSAKQ